MSEVTANSHLTLEQAPESVGAKSFKLGHRPELDGLRGISILFVLGLHLGINHLRGGFLGVDIFFVLSGFLITSLLVQEANVTGTIRLKSFYIRRALRLVPALVVFLIGTGLYALFFLNKEKAADVYRGILLTMSYVTNWVFALRPHMDVGPLGPTWSLAIEEQFYLLWPLILLLFVKLKIRRRMVIFTIVLAIVAVAIHRRLLLDSGTDFRRMYYGTDTRADALLIGCLVALLLSWGLLPQTDLFRRAMKTLAVLGTVFIAYLVLTITQENPNLYRGFATLVPLGVGAILIMLMLWPPAYVLVLLRLSPLRWVGRISYGLYLWHYPIRVFVCPDDHPCSGRHVLIPAAVAFAVTCLSFYLVEKPFLRMKKHFANA